MYRAQWVPLGDRARLVSIRRVRVVERVRVEYVTSLHDRGHKSKCTEEKKRPLEHYRLTPHSFHDHLPVQPPTLLPPLAPFCPSPPFRTVPAPPVSYGTALLPPVSPVVRVITPLLVCVSLPKKGDAHVAAPGAGAGSDPSIRSASLPPQSRRHTMARDGASQPRQHAGPHSRAGRRVDCGGWHLIARQEARRLRGGGGDGCGD